MKHIYIPYNRASYVQGDEFVFWIREVDRWMQEAVRAMEELREHACACPECVKNRHLLALEEDK